MQVDLSKFEEKDHTFISFSNTTDSFFSLSVMIENKEDAKYVFVDLFYKQQVMQSFEYKFLHTEKYAYMFETVDADLYNFVHIFRKSYDCIYMHLKNDDIVKLNDNSYSINNSGSSMSIEFARGNQTNRQFGWNVVGKFAHFKLFSTQFADSYDESWTDMKEILCNNAAIRLKAVYLCFVEFMTKTMEMIEDQFILNEDNCNVDR